MQTHTGNPRFDPSRRQALRLMAALVPVVAAAACAPARIVLRAYPAEFKGESSRAQATLEAFVCTVEPGAIADVTGAARTLQDRYYPLARYAGYLASDLDRRASRTYGHAFSDLACSERATVVTAGLSAGGVTGKLYAGAVYLTQVAVYAGLGTGSDTPVNLPPSGNDGVSRPSVAWMEATSRMPSVQTLNGNPA